MIARLAPFLLLCSCGVNLMQQRCEIDVLAPDGGVAVVRAEIRPTFGLAFVWLDGVGPGAVILLPFVEPLDFASSLWCSTRAVFDPDESVAFGPLGAVFALLPGITTVASEPGLPDAALQLTPDEFTALCGDDEAARGTALGDAIRRSRRRSPEVDGFAIVRVERLDPVERSAFDLERE